MITAGQGCRFFELNRAEGRLKSVMKTCFMGLLSVLAFLAFSAGAAKADEFSQIANSPNIYWVPAPTPGYAGAPYYYGAYYGGPPGYYYGPPPAPPPPVVVAPRFFFGIHTH